MKAAHKNFWIIFAVLCVVLVASFQVGRRFFDEEERLLRSRVRKTVVDMYPEIVERLKAAYGLKALPTVDTKVKDVAERPDVILVHGLDEPGKIWMNLAPALIQEGFRVWNLTYPNDQPITESAHFFLRQIETGPLSAAKSISVVAHSMGGLVAREMLTDPALRYAEKARQKKIPAVDRLIMVGTPNHGSELAQFRFFTEMRDQLTSMFGDRYHWLQGFVDGAGEAGIDLIPGSRFLTRLNRRSHPDGVKMVAIAGVISPWHEDDIEQLVRQIEAGLPEEARVLAEKIKKVLLSASDGIGDGLVSVDSVRLQGVLLRVVQGTHLSMIRNIGEVDQRIPPAVPVIVEHLKTSESN